MHLDLKTDNSKDSLMLNRKIIYNKKCNQILTEKVLPNPGQVSQKNHMKLKKIAKTLQNSVSITAKCLLS